MTQRLNQVEQLLADAIVFLSNHTQRRKTVIQLLNAWRRYHVLKAPWEKLETMTVGMGATKDFDRNFFSPKKGTSKITAAWQLNTEGAMVISTLTGRIRWPQDPLTGRMLSDVIKQLD